MIAQSIKWGVIGLGRCGANLAEEFYLRGYPVITLNSSITDFRICNLPPDNKYSIGINQRDGAGQDTILGEKCLLQNSQNIIDRVSKIMVDTDEVLLVAGLGGGTGSAVPILLEVLQPLNFNISCMVTIPWSGEGSIVKINSIKMLNRLLRTNVHSIIVIDNQKVVSRSANEELLNMYKISNRQIVGLFDELNRISRNQDYKPYLGLDVEDLRRIFRQRGLCHIQKIDLIEDDLKSGERLFRRFSEDLDDGGILISGYDYSQASSAAIIMILSDQMIKSISSKILNDFTARIKDLFAYPGIYMGIFSCSNNCKPVVYCVATGFSIPQRIMELLEQAKTEGKQLSFKALSGISSLKIGDFDKMRIPDNWRNI